MSKEKVNEISRFNEKHVEKHASRRSIRNFIKEKIKFDDEQSTMSKDDLMKFLDLGDLPTDTVLKKAEPHELPEDCLGCWVVLYEYRSE